jgi:hypothetical protein
VRQFRRRGNYHSTRTEMAWTAGDQIHLWNLTHESKNISCNLRGLTRTNKILGQKRWICDQSEQVSRLLQYPAENSANYSTHPHITKSMNRKSSPLHNCHSYPRNFAFLPRSNEPNTCCLYPFLSRPLLFAFGTLLLPDGFLMNASHGKTRSIERSHE